MGRVLPGCLLAGLLFSGSAATAQPAPEYGGPHDFDFEFGAWRTHVRVLAHPLTESQTWVQYDGTSLVRKIWQGAANLVELDVRSKSGGRLRLASLRLYDPATRQWGLYTSNVRTGTLGVPAVGGFSGGRGVFYDKEVWDGKPILVRFAITPRSSAAVHFVQAFSTDDGKTWETNWIADDTRVVAGH